MIRVSEAIFTGAQIVTCESSRPECVHSGVALAVQDGTIAGIASEQELQSRYPLAQRIDCSGCVITPGLIDSHTHAVFGVWRSAEYELRSQGVPYMEIARRGGGINATVRDVRARSEDDLLECSIPRVLDFLRFGTTTVEIKSGYGLTTADELKLLRVIARLQEHVPVRIVPTFMGAHEFPDEYRSRRDDYVELLATEMIPAVAEARLARFCDVFLEAGAFDFGQARRVLQAGIEHGLAPKLHADELENSRGAQLAAELGAASADHLGAISEAGIEALAASGTVATLLPATLLFLGKMQFAPARALIDAGATISLATDFNPGTAPTSNLPLAMTLACSQMKVTPLEAITAATSGGARALLLPNGSGTLVSGAPADLVVWAVSDYREIPYRFGNPQVREAWVQGSRVFGGL
jgi:imidazolonepropionase